MIPLKEVVEKTKETGKKVEAILDNGYFDYDEVNIFGTGQGLRGGHEQTPIKEGDANQIMETLRAVPLGNLVKKLRLSEVLMPGLAGANNLVPTKIYQVMYDSAVQADICADISITMIPAEQLPGNQVKVDIAVDNSYVPHKYMAPGAQPTETIQTAQATLDFSTPFGINFQITNDLIEDSQFNLVEMHLRDAGREMGEFASNEAVKVLDTATDGDGTLNTEAGGSNTTTLLDVLNAIDANLQDGYISDTFLTSHHQMYGEIIKDTTYSQDATGFRDELIREGYPTRLLGMNVIYSEVTQLAQSAAGVAYQALDSLVFAKDYALVTGRKRWLRIEKYSDPIRDLVGATITCRQDSVTIYNDSICQIREV